MRERDQRSVMALVLWITGLPGSGKSTIAEGLRERHPDFVILRMDDLRKIATPAPSYSEGERDILYRSMVYSAEILSKLGHNVIIDATGNRRRWRDLARETVPSFVEVYLRCEARLCREREEERREPYGAPPDIYDKGRRGWPVPGVTIPYEPPKHPEVEVDSGRLSVDEIVQEIEGYISAHMPKMEY